MPQRLEGFFNNLNRSNIRRRLFSLYKWNVGRENATRAGYVNWLDDLATWYEDIAAESIVEDVEAVAGALDEDEPEAEEDAEEADQELP